MLNLHRLILSAVCATLLLVSAARAADDPKTPEALDPASNLPPSILSQAPLMGSPSVAALAALYDGEAKYDIYRKNKRIGKHSVSFKQVKDGWEVTNKLRIKVKFLFIVAYKLEYDSTSYWVEDQLQWVRAKVNDNGRKLKMSGAVEDATFRWTNIEDEQFEVPVGDGYLPTNHWNTAILDETRVLNTLTGNQDTIAITSGGWETLETEEGPVLAEKLVYSGDLTNRSWYDPDGRWVSLAFEGKDGSTIRYKCRSCGVTPMAPNYDRLSKPADAR